MGSFEIINNATNSHILEMIELDKLVFKGENIGSYDKCKEWLSINPQTYTILLFNNKIIGYINFIPISDKCYNLIKEGKLKDYQIKREDILKFNSNKPLKCLFTSIAIDPSYQKGTALLLLWKGFLKKIKNLNINVTSIIMDCVSSMGEKCAITCFNAKFICPSRGGKIYEGNFKWLH